MSVYISSGLLAAVVPMQGSITDFLQFSLLVGPVLILFGIGLLIGWTIEVRLFPDSLADAVMNGYWLMFTWFCLLLSLFSVCAFYLQQPSSFWKLIIYLIVITGFVQGGIVFRKVRKWGKRSPRSLNRSLPPTPGPPRPDTNFIETWRAKRSYKLYAAAIRLIVTAIVGVFVLQVSRGYFRVADAMFTVYIGLTAVDTLIWRSRRVFVVDNEPYMSKLAVLGLMCCILGANIIRFPDFFIPGSQGIRSSLRESVPYAPRLIEAYLTIPVEVWLIAIVQFAGFILGFVWAGIRYWSLLESDDSTQSKQTDRVRQY